MLKQIIGRWLCYVLLCVHCIWIWMGYVVKKPILAIIYDVNRLHQDVYMPLVLTDICTYLNTHAGYTLSEGKHKYSIYHT